MSNLFPPPEALRPSREGQSPAATWDVTLTHRPQPLARRCDVAIIGGGPAGTATALTLAAVAPELDVVLAEASDYRQPRLGECLPPAARGALQRLGVLQRFLAAGHRAVLGGDDQLPDTARPPILRSHRGLGWHLDRTAFDAMLADAAAQRGVEVRLATRFEHVVPEVGRADELRLTFAEQTTSTTPANTPVVLSARFVVDASGQTAVFARQMGARAVARDRRVAFGRYLHPDPTADPRLLVEVTRDGWWYSLGLPNSRRLVCCLAEPDVATQLTLADPAGWERAFTAAPKVRATAGARPQFGALIAQPNESRLLEPAFGRSWLAVGDSASIVDPFAAQGIVKALRAGTVAGRAIALALAGRKAAAPTRPTSQAPRPISSERFTSRPARAPSGELGQLIELASRR